VIENELVLPDMKSDRTQKNVTVYKSQKRIYKGVSERTVREIFKSSSWVQKR